MKAFLICPAQRAGVLFLSETAPLALRPVLGKVLLEHWIEHLVRGGATQIILSVADRPHQIRAMVAEGCRWGVRVQVLPQERELSLHEARAMFHPNGETDWLARPDDFNVTDHLPGLPQRPLFNSYMGWFAAVIAALRLFEPCDRIGLREIQPGVWAGLGARIGKDVVLRAPCWIGENVAIGARAVIGPMTVLEDRVVVEKRAEVVQSLVGRDTFIGPVTEIRQSLVEGDRLLNWRSESSLRVADPFLLSSFQRPQSPARWQRWRRAMERWLSRAPAGSPASAADIHAPAMEPRAVTDQSSARRAA